MKSRLTPRSRIRRAFDIALFPVRALFIPEENSFGLTSLREERFEEVAKLCRGKVLDVGCGKFNLFIENWIGHRSGTGIDVYPYDGVKNVVTDMTALPFDTGSFDTLTLIAVGGHIPQNLRDKEFSEFARVLKSGGKLVMTEGEPITQTLGHLWRHYSLALIGKLGMDDERGMEHDEQYCMPKAELMSYLNTPPLRFLARKRFMWGLNNVYVAVKL